jgi:hypothetical protein
MRDESQRFDWFQQPPTWPQWMPNALWNGGPKPPVPPEVPARIAFDWEEGPNGGLIGRPNPLWNQSNSYWWESIPSASANAGILGSLPPLAGSPLSDPGPVNPHMAAWQSLALPSPSALPPIFPSAPPIGGWALSSPHWLKTAAPFGMNSGGPASPMSQTDHDPSHRRT